MDTAEQLRKKYGNKIFKTAKEKSDKPHEIISVSPAIDLQIGGGVPEGSVVLLSGDPKCGKTVTALQICRNAQRAGKQVFYLNIEGRVKDRDFGGIEGLDLDAIEIAESFREGDEAKIISGEEWLMIAEDYIHNKPGCVVVLDSISQIATEKEILAEIGDRPRDGGYRLISQFIKRATPVIGINRCIVIGIQHLISNISGMGASKIATGGRKIKYAVDVDLICKYVERWNVSDANDSEQIGQIVNWVTGSTAIMPPGRKIKSYLRYGTGLDEVRELIELGSQIGFIRKSGAWFVLEYMKEHMEWKVDNKGKLQKETAQQVQRQGIENIWTLLKQNQEFLEHLRTDVKNLIFSGTQ